MHVDPGTRNYTYTRTEVEAPIAITAPATRDNAALTVTLCIIRSLEQPKYPPLGADTCPMVSVDRTRAYLDPAPPVSRSLDSIRDRLDPCSSGSDR